MTERILHVTFASELLRAALEARSGQARLQKLLSMERQELVGRWSRGERRPTPPTRFRIQDLMGIDARHWDEPAPVGFDFSALARKARRRLDKAYALKGVGGESPTFRGARVA